MLVLGLLSLGLLSGVVACGSSSSAGDNLAASPSASAGPGDALSVAQALRASAGASVRVRGYVLVAPGGDAQLCAGLAGSYPPQCGRPALRLKGLRLETLGRHESAQGVNWTGEVILPGTVEGGVLTVT